LGIPSIKSFGTFGTMKLAIFGGSGFTGTEVVRYALKKGHEVTLLLRNPDTLEPVLRDKVKNIIVGDVTDIKKVNETVAGNEAVVVALGTRNVLEPTTQMSGGLANILQVMKDTGLSRISVCLSSFLFRELNQVPPTLLNVHNEHMSMLKLLEESSLDWLALCAPHIAKEVSSETVQLLNDGRVGPRIWVGHLAENLVDLLDKPEHYKHKVGIGYPATA